jgi:hypothetical protein
MPHTSILFCWIHCLSCLSWMQDICTHAKVWFGYFTLLVSVHHTSHCSVWGCQWLNAPERSYCTSKWWQKQTKVTCDLSMQFKSKWNVLCISANVMLYRFLKEYMPVHPLKPYALKTDVMSSYRCMLHYVLIQRSCLLLKQVFYLL